MIYENFRNVISNLIFIAKKPLKFVVIKLNFQSEMTWRVNTTSLSMSISGICLLPNEVGIDILVFNEVIVV